MKKSKKKKISNQLKFSVKKGGSEFIISPKLLGQGSYGCVYKPSLNFEKNSCTPSPDPEALENTVSKWMEVIPRFTDTENEIDFGEMVTTQILNWNDYFAPIFKTCKIDKNDIKYDQYKSNCRPLLKRKIPTNKTKLYLVPYVGRKIMIFRNIGGKNNIDKLNNYYNSIKHVFSGILKLQQINIIHKDIKELNIMLSDKENDTNPAKIIDFGLSCHLTKNKNLSFYNLFNIFSPSYYYWPLLLHFFSFIVDNVINSNFAYNLLFEDRFSIEQKGKKIFIGNLENISDEEWIVYENEEKIKIVKLKQNDFIYSLIRPKILLNPEGSIFDISYIADTNKKFINNKINLEQYNKLKIKNEKEINMNLLIDIFIDDHLNDEADMKEIKKRYLKRVVDNLKNNQQSMSGYGKKSSKRKKARKKSKKKKFKKGGAGFSENNDNLRQVNKIKNFIYEWSKTIDFYSLGIIVKRDQELKKIYNPTENCLLTKKINDKTIFQHVLDLADLDYTKRIITIEILKNHFLSSDLNSPKKN